MSAPSSGITPNYPVSLPRLIDIVKVKAPLIDIDSGHFWKSDVGECKLTDTVFYVGSFAEIMNILTQYILNMNTRATVSKAAKSQLWVKTFVNQRNLKTSYQARVSVSTLKPDRIVPLETLIP